MLRLTGTDRTIKSKIARNETLGRRTGLERNLGVKRIRAMLIFSCLTKLMLSVNFRVGMAPRIKWIRPIGTSLPEDAGLDSGPERISTVDGLI